MTCHFSLCEIEQWATNNAVYSMLQLHLLSQALVIESPCCHVAGHTFALFGPNMTDENAFKYVRREIVAAEPFDACEGDLQPDLTDKIALIARGMCNFSRKVLQAQRAHEIAVVIMDNQPRAPDEPWVIQMVADNSSNDVNILSIFVSYETGKSILGNISSCHPVLVTLNSTGSLINPRKDRSIGDNLLYGVVSIIIAMLKNVILHLHVSIDSPSGFNVVMNNHHETG
ncbi:hypothetical protein Ae201684P_006346 [Aphanomyces euteiches]|uniref:PA domain-containing protein n=1 Tax=Aphanomyces euteiches TaxID=100861 RepID=A0A6G0XAY2_9STRA|nr:hypothetical protein Ae201684_006405 [Aphanomyces euteiches]KAH9090943.1 hypothetical protein Ae201684P_006346 [Aphanomyces euteiches]